MAEEADQDIIARFVRGDVLVDERRYLDVDQIPYVIEICRRAPLNDWC